VEGIEKPHRTNTRRLGTTGIMTAAPSEIFTSADLNISFPVWIYKI
jgi:hypothetical protein